MSLGWDIDAALPQLQAAAESTMRDTCKITRDGVKVWDEETLTYMESTTTVYDGKCKVKQSNVQVANVEAAGQLLTVQQSVLSLPVATSAGVRVGDVVEITGIGARSDPALLGVKFTIDGGHIQTSSTARRLSVKVVT